jgi:PQQ enzyme repeat
MLPCRCSSTLAQIPIENTGISILSSCSKARAPGMNSAALLVATEDNVVYAIDAQTGREIWQKTLGKPIPRSSLSCGNINPLGITGTPVIDDAAQTIISIQQLRTRPGCTISFTRWRSRTGRSSMAGRTSALGADHPAAEVGDFSFGRIAPDFFGTGQCSGRR